MSGFTIPQKRPDGSWKSPEELGDELAAALEERGIDPDSLRLIAVEDHTESPLIQRIPLEARYIKVQS